jgi:hypothetical protein
MFGMNQRTMTVREFTTQAQKSDFLKVIEEIDRLGCVPKNRNSTKFSIAYPPENPRFYPPKYVLMRAAEIRFGVHLSPCSGGRVTNTPLRDIFNFEIVDDHPSNIPEK